eukprot:892051-Prymnesium_polylepis.1
MRVCKPASTRSVYGCIRQYGEKKKRNCGAETGVSSLLYDAPVKPLLTLGVYVGGFTPRSGTWNLVRCVCDAL